MKQRLLTLTALLCSGISLVIPTAAAEDTVYSDVATDVQMYGMRKQWRNSA